VDHPDHITAFCAAKAPLCIALPLLKSRLKECVSFCVSSTIEHDHNPIELT
jgi:hypothetical protein